MTITFLTFGGPTERYHNNVDRICKEAGAFNIFNNIVGLKDDYLKNDANFWDMHHKFIENNLRGYGHWLWKPYIVKKQLELMNDNDILVYADSGCELNVNGLHRLIEYFNIVNAHECGLLSFQMKHLLEKAWTKMDTMAYLNASDLANTGQLMATSFVIRKCAHTVKLVNLWYYISCNYHLIDDTPSQLPNDKSFREHRHDQSIWSILRKQLGATIIPDETWFSDWSDGASFPILAKRI
jgi:hypothetical protein